MAPLLNSGQTYPLPLRTNTPSPPKTNVVFQTLKSLFYYKEPTNNIHDSGVGDLRYLNRMK